jgi:hypothetical protein
MNRFTISASHSIVRSQDALAVIFEVVRLNHIPMTMALLASKEISNTTSLLPLDRIQAGGGADRLKSVSSVSANAAVASTQTLRFMREGKHRWRKVAITLLG